MIIDCHNHIGAEMGMYLRGDFPYAQHLSVMVQEGRALGVDRWIVFPMVTHLALNLAALREGVLTSEGAMDRVPYEWENRRMMTEIYELFPEEGKSTVPFVMLDPLRETAGQAEALRRLRQEYSFHGLKMQTTMLQAPIKSLLDEGRVFLELAEEWDLPLLIHSSVLPADLWAQAKDILDVVEEAPGVRFCVAHSLRFDREQLDRLAALPNAWFDCSAHGIHCRLATQDSPVVAPVERRFESDFSRPERVLLDLAGAYPDKLMWGSDSPYYSFVAMAEGRRLELFNTYAAEVEYLMALPEDIRERIAHNNILAFLGHTPPALSS